SSTLSQSTYPLLPYTTLVRSTYLQVLSNHGATFKHWAAQGLGLGSPQRISISELGTRLLALKPGDPTLAQDMARGKFSFAGAVRSEEQRLNSSHVAISYAVFC